MWNDNARENACIFSLSFFYNRAVFKHVFYSERVPACLPLIESITAGAISFEDSEVNFIGNFSFEGNHANDSGGKIRGNLATAQFDFIGNVSLEVNHTRRVGGGTSTSVNEVPSIFLIFRERLLELRL